MIRNPLFFHANRSFDFGKKVIYQYTLSSTHLIPLTVENDNIVRIY